MVETPDVIVMQCLNMIVCQLNLFRSVSKTCVRLSITCHRVRATHALIKKTHTSTYWTMHFHVWLNSCCFCAATCSMRTNVKNPSHVKSSQMALINCADRAMKNVQDLSCHKHETKPVAVSYICGIQISQLEPTGSSKNQMTCHLNQVDSTSCNMQHSTCIFALNKTGHTPIFCSLTSRRKSDA